MEQELHALKLRDVPRRLLNKYTRAMSQSDHIESKIVHLDKEDIEYLS